MLLFLGTFRGQLYLLKRKVNICNHFVWLRKISIALNLLDLFLVYCEKTLDRFFLRNEAKIRNMRNDHQIWKFFLRNGCSPIKKIKILFAQWDITDVTEKILFAQWHISLSEIHFLILFAQWANVSHRTEFVEFELINVLEYQGNWNSIIKD